MKTKNQFLTELNRHLEKLSKTEKEEIIAFYEERFKNAELYESKTEEEVIKDLEDPKQIARNVLQEYGLNPDTAIPFEAEIHKAKHELEALKSDIKKYDALTQKSRNSENPITSEIDRLKQDVSRMNIEEVEKLKYIAEIAKIEYIKDIDAAKGDDKLNLLKDEKYSYGLNELSQLKRRIKNQALISGFTSYFTGLKDNVSKWINKDPDYIAEKEKQKAEKQAYKEQKQKEKEEYKAFKKAQAELEKLRREEASAKAKAEIEAQILEQQKRYQEEIANRPARGYSAGNVPGTNTKPISEYKKPAPAPKPPKYTKREMEAMSSDMYYKSGKGTRITLMIIADVIVFSWLLPTIFAVIVAFIAICFALFVSSLVLIAVSFHPGLPYDIFTRIGVILVLMSLFIISKLGFKAFINMMVSFFEQAINMHYNGYTGNSGKNYRFKRPFKYKKMYFFRNPLVYFSVGVIICILCFSDLYDSTSDVLAWLDDTFVFINF